MTSKNLAASLNDALKKTKTATILGECISSIIKHVYVRSRRIPLETTGQKISGTNVKISGTHVKISGTHVKIPGTHIKISKTHLKIYSTR